MQYKKNKKIEATRPFLCGKKNCQMVIFFQSGKKKKEKRIFKLPNFGKKSI